MTTDLLGGMVAGWIGGFASGLFGITSGGILVPLLVLILGQEQHAAQGLSLVIQVLPTSLSGAQRYWASGHGVPTRWLVWICGGFIVGCMFGAWFARGVAEPVLRWCFVGYLLVLLALLARRRSGDKAALLHDRPKEASSAAPLFLAAAGLVAGASSGFLGIGGGLAITALLTAFLHLAQHRAQAVSLAVTALPVTLPGALLYFSESSVVPWSIVITTVVGLWIGTAVGSRIANMLSPPVLRIGMIATIAAMAAFMAYRAAAG